MSIIDHRSAESSLEIIVAIGGPKTIQQTNDSKRSFNKTRIVFCVL